MATLSASPPVDSAKLQAAASLSTIPDTRTPPISSTHIPPLDLSTRQSLDGDQESGGEVATISVKLINAINHSTTLDDSLQHTRHELDSARASIADLQSQNANHVELVTSGALVKKAEVDTLIQQLRADLEGARRERETAEQSRRQMEVELENLTSSLFEEANTMVANARRETEAAEKRTLQVKSQLQDTEVLLVSQQDQLRDLKDVMESLRPDTTNAEASSTLATAPPSPKLDADERYKDTADLRNDAATTHVYSVAPPLHYAALIHPLVRTDLQAYHEFVDLLRANRPTLGHTRSASGEVSSIQRDASLAAPTHASPSLPGSFAYTSSSPREANFVIVPLLKDSKFFKRCMTEDIEPALRLDTAPSISYFGRRSVLAAVTTSALLIEPFSAPSRPNGPVYPCGLCGEDRLEEPYFRRHRFCTSDEANAQKYPLCGYCLGRMRATADFISFLRTVRDGLWRSQTSEEIQSAWDECIRLREKLFWARLGGGVVPTALWSQSQAQRAQAQARETTPVAETERLDDGNDLSRAQSTGQSYKLVSAEQMDQVSPTKLPMGEATLVETAPGE